MVCQPQIIFFSSGFFVQCSDLGYSYTSLKYNQQKEIMEGTLH